MIKNVTIFYFLAKNAQQFSPLPYLGIRSLNAGVSGNVSVEVDETQEV